MNCLKMIRIATRNLYLRRDKSSLAITYSEYGDPIKVLQQTESDLAAIGPKDVMIKVIAAPINPADINTIQGTYGVKSTLPAVGGNEGFGEVQEVGSEVKTLKPGQWVIPSFQGKFNTWRTHYLGPENDFLQIPNNLSIESAATLSVNPCTAYRMLKDFVALKPNDTVIQNGANSGVGQAAIQLAKLMGLKSINIVRNREGFEDMKNYLVNLGADFVITEEDLRSAKMDEIFSTVPKPKLAFNCVGGKSTTDMLRHLESGGVMVTYGGMSRQPVILPTASLIFKDFNVRGFWMTRWVQINTFAKERTDMLKYICDASIKGDFKPAKSVLQPFENYKEAIKNIMVPFISQKYILVMDPKYLK